MIAQVPNPDERRDAANGAATGGAMQNARGAQQAGTIHGVPINKVIKDMRNAGIPPAIIQQYVNDAMKGANVPHHSSFTAVAQSALKGQSNAKTPKVRDTTQAI